MISASVRAKKMVWKYGINERLIDFYSSPNIFFLHLTHHQFNSKLKILIAVRPQIVTVPDRNRKSKPIQ